MCPAVRLGDRQVFGPGPRLMKLFFFFQAEDGIRDVAVTGVQTCALPIYVLASYAKVLPMSVVTHRERQGYARSLEELLRSEERRVGKECRSRWSPYH